MPSTLRPRAVLAVAATLLLLAVVAAPAAGSPTERRPEPVVSLPVDGEVLRLFVAPAVRWGPGHRGVDLVAPPDGVVRAPADGTLVFVGRVVDRGVLTLDHGDGRRSSFEPVTALKPVGTEVRRGDPVAAVEPDGLHCAVPCVHWGVRRAAGAAGPGHDGEPWVYIDPLSLLGPPRVRLLPWE